MKFFTQFVLLALVLILTTKNANAQTEWQKEKAQEQAGDLQAALNLDDEMATKVYEIHLATQVMLMEVRDAEAKGILTKKEKEIVRKKLWKQNQIQINEVLGDDLAEKHRFYRKKNKSKKEKITSKNDIIKKGKEDIKALNEELDWNETTLAKISAINLEAYQALQVISDEIRAKKKAGEEVDMEAVKESRKEVWANTTNEIKSLVGKEKFKEYRDARKKVKQASK